MAAACTSIVVLRARTNMAGGPQHKHSATSTALGYCPLYSLRAVEPSLRVGGGGASFYSQFVCPYQLASHVNKTALSVCLAAQHIVCYSLLLK
jgi:hypothetical protein